MKTRMKVYIATAWTNKDQAKEARTKLLEAGLEVNSRWLDVQGSVGGMGSPLDKMVTEANHDWEDVVNADVFLLLNNQKRGEETSGKAVETGMALQSKKKVIMVGEPSNIFHLLSEVTVCKSIEEAVGKICQLT